MRVILSDGTQHTGMLNIGHRPTLGVGSERSIEVHIFDFESNLYSQPLTLAFEHYMRPEMKFDNLNQLMAQLHLDAAQVKTLLH